MYCSREYQLTSRSNEYICRICHYNVRTQPNKQTRMPKQSIEVLSEDKIQKQASARFNKKWKDNPEYMCTSCHRMLFKKIVLQEEHYDFDSIIVQKTFSQYWWKWKYLGEYICYTFKHCLQKQSKTPKLPAKALTNNLALTDIPTYLAHLTYLERRFISLRLPFMKILCL